MNELLQGFTGELAFICSIGPSHKYLGMKLCCTSSVYTQDMEHVMC